MNMAMKQGRCPNCGSLLMVNDADAKGVCMFCHARFNPARAIQIDQNPDDVEFPNEPQDALTEEENQLAFSSVRSVQVAAPVRSQPAPRKKKASKPGQLTPQQKVAMQKRVLIEPEVSKQDKLKMIGSIAAVLVIMAAIFLPLTLRRVSKEKELAQRINEIAVFDVPGSEYYDFNGFRNTELVIVSPVEVTEADVASVMANYKAARAEIYELSSDDLQNNVRLRVAAPNGNFERNGAGD